MQQKRLLIFALVMLLAGIGFMVWDMFFSTPQPAVNPYEYDLRSLKAGDTSLVQYREVLQVKLQMDTIHGLATDRLGKIYVAGRNSVEIFLPDGKPAGTFPVSGMAYCIHVDSTGLIFLGLTDRIEIRGQDGKVLRQWKCPGEDAFITSIASTAKDVFVADAGDRVVYRFDRSGNLLKRIGEKDPQRNIPGFVVPSPYFDLAVGRDGNLWVANTGRHSLEKFSPDGDLLTSWGSASMAVDGFCGCCNPSHFALLADGSFVTAEKGIERIKVYSPQGKFLCVAADPSSFTEGTRGLDVATDPQGRILVLDPERKQIRFFMIKK